MTSYQWLDIGTPSDYDKLLGLIDEEFAPAAVIPQLKSGISAAVKGVLIEFEYIDKDYRSTYYNFYAKKGRRYRNDCVRLHFFSQLVKFDEDQVDLECTTGVLEDNYFGFMVLRPTLVWTIGRSILSPDIRMGAQGFVIIGRHRVHLLGRTLSLWGFPSMDQHSDIAVCAHTACWSVLRHYSATFPWQRELLVHDITQMASQFDPGGLVPSIGLDIFEAERIFQAAGTFPLMVAKGSSPKSFYRQLLAYLESGLPLFVEMPKLSHAIAAIGYSWRSPPGPVCIHKDHAWNQVEKVIVADDNVLPYHSVATGSTGSDYSSDDFNRFIVALPDKVYYPADAVEQHSRAFASVFSGLLKIPPSGELIRRYFVMSIASLRRYVRKNQSQFGDRLLGAIMELGTAQYVWIIEYASAEQWARGVISTRAILDATASLRDPNPVWLAHDDSKALFFNRESMPSADRQIDLNLPHAIELGRLERNLRPITVRA